MARAPVSRSGSTVGPGLHTYERDTTERERECLGGTRVSSASWERSTSLHIRDHATERERGPWGEGELGRKVR